MGFFGGNIVRMAVYLEELQLKEMIRRLGEFSDAEIDQLQKITDVPMDEIVDILELIFDPERTLEEKVSDLENVESSTQILIAFATMNRQIK